MHNLDFVQSSKAFVIVCTINQTVFVIKTVQYCLEIPTDFIFLSLYFNYFENLRISRELSWHFNKDTLCLFVGQHTNRFEGLTFEGDYFVA